MMLFQISDFGFRISDFPPTPSEYTLVAMDNSKLKTQNSILR